MQDAKLPTGSVKSLTDMGLKNLCVVVEERIAIKLMKATKEVVRKGKRVR